MIRTIALSALAATAVLSACTPQPAGVCEADTACKGDERCHQGLCIKRSLLGDGGSAADGGSDGGLDGGGDGGGGQDGGADAGEDGGTDGGIDAGCLGAECTLGLLIQKPGASAVVGGTFHVEAQASTSAPPDDVTFTLVTPVGSALLASATVTTAGAGQLYAADLSVPSSVTGDANLIATLHLGSRSFVAQVVPLVIDQLAPTLSTTWSGGPWRSAAGTFVVPATVNDDHGVASARLDVQLADGGTARFTATLSGSSATFNVPAAGLAVPGAAVALPFTIAATDLAGNTAALAPAPGSILRVDDEKPSLAVATDSAWHRTTATVVASATDHAGAGVDPGGFSIAAGGATVSAALDGGSALLTVDLSGVPAGFEGPLPFQVVATDLAGNAADAGGVILVDRAPPTVSLLSVLAPDRGQWYRADAGPDIAMRFTIDAGPGSPINAASVMLNAGRDLVADTGLPMTTFLIPRDAGTGVEGVVAVQIRASDLAGNQATYNTSLFFDDRPPTLDGGIVIADGGAWVARKGPGPDGGPVDAHVLVSAIDLGVGLASLTPYSLDGGTALGAAATNGAGPSTYELTLDVSSATPGAAGPFAFSVRAVDAFGNAAVRAYSVAVDDAEPQVDPVADTTWHSGLTGSTTASVSPVVNITDEGVGVAGAPSLSSSTSGVLSSARLISGTPNAGVWRFDAFNVPSDPALSGSVIFPVIAFDAVGNRSALNASIGLLIDNQPPALGAVSAPPDASTWFRGPSVAQSGDNDIDVALQITEPNLLGTPSATFAAAGSPVSGQIKADGKWHFAIPRLLGAGGGTKRVTLQATDKASNSAQTFIDLPFEDAPAAFTVASAATWYARTGADLSIVATVIGPPPSGLASTTLSGPSCPTIGGVASGNTLTFALPRACAPAAVEAAYRFTIKLTSNAGVASSIDSLRNIDDVPPVLSTPTFATSTLKLNAGLVSLGSFTAYDCGSGLANGPSSPPDVGVSGTPATRQVVVTDTGAATCPDQRTVPLRTFELKADLNTAPRWTYGIDVSLPVSALVADVAGNGSTAQGSVQATRRLWSNTTVSATRLAMGPSLFSGGSTGLYALNPATGTETVVALGSISAGPAVAPNPVGNGPVVYWTAGSNLNGASATTYAAGSSCGGEFHSSNAFKRVVLLADGATAASTNFTNDFGIDWTLAPGGCALTNPISQIDGTVVAKTSYFSTVNFGLKGHLLNGSTDVNNSSFFNARFLIALDNNGDTALVSGPPGGSAVFNGVWGPQTSFPTAPQGQIVALSRPWTVISTNGSQWRAWDLAGPTRGSPVGSSQSNTVLTTPIIDGAQPAAVYLPGPAGPSTLSIFFLDATNQRFDTTPSLLNITLTEEIDDFVLSKGDAATNRGAILFLAAGGTVRAVYTDSPGLGLGLGGNSEQGWPTRGHDACRSYNLGFSCPY